MIGTKQKVFLAFVGVLMALIIAPLAGASDCQPAKSGQHPDIRVIGQKPSITGNVLADHRIYTMAELRGYRLQSILADESLLVFPYSVHPCVASAWKQLETAASEQGYNISIMSGYRSIARQRQIFLSKLKSAGVSPYRVAAGLADKAVNHILDFSSIPGYSRHHTGFTIDIQYNGEGLNAFGDSPAYQWLSADNFKIARSFGFLPSYPQTLTSQGPVPEPWEFIWVGDTTELADKPVRTTTANNLLTSAQRILFSLDQQQIGTASFDRRGDGNTITSPTDSSLETLPGG
ncbi:MAG: hypothetical protein DHS20C01_08420 [marine bacterium B5-7]|nr:MAG: hypothetical protein DHS20C01_08420 [marine bacterium B5-7]